MRLHPDVENLRCEERRLVRELGLLGGDIAELEVTHAQCHALIELGERGALTPAALAEALRLDKGTGSRVVRSLVDQGLAAVDDGRAPRGAKAVALTDKGRQQLDRIDGAEKAQIDGVLRLLTDEERRAVLDGLSTFADALARRRAQAAFVVRPIEARDDPAVAALIRAVMSELGADGPGFAIHDPEVDAMTQAYIGPRSTFLVVEREQRVVGGAGYGPLEGAEPTVCELRKMYFLPEARGQGLGKRLLLDILTAARADGFEVCYLETLESMQTARALYAACGFEVLDAPMGSTGHFGCDRWMARKL